MPCSPKRPHCCSILWPHRCHGYNNKLPAHTAISRSTASGLAVSENTASREMPIASGAAGRADVDPDTAVPDRPKTRTKPAKGDWDSYLERYQELQERKKQNKSNLSQGVQDKTAPGDEEREGVKEESPQEDVNGEDPTPGAAGGGEKSKKSGLCVLL